MGGFFVAWALWEEMTFVLAVAIVIVFCMGLIKLWWTNRTVNKQEVLDAEKRARTTEIRKTGLSSRKGGNDIPFGIRAIQSGVEVDGIWISRPPSANRESAKLERSTTTTLLGDIESHKGKEKMYTAEEDRQESRPNSSSTTGRTAPWHTVSDQSTLEGYALHDTTDESSNKSTPLPRISENPRRSPNALNEEALLRLQGEGHHGHSSPRVPSRYALQPDSSAQQYYRPTQRSSASVSSASSASSESSQSQGISQRVSKTEGRIPGSLYGGHRTYPNTAATESRSSPPQASPNQVAFDHTASLVSPEGEQQWLHHRGNGQHPRQDSNQLLSMPQPTFEPDDAYAAHRNRASRRVNTGFEVLSAGTFGSQQQQSTSSSDDRGEDVEAVFARNTQRRPYKSSSGSRLAGPF